MCAAELHKRLYDLEFQKHNKKKNLETERERIVLFSSRSYW